MPQKNDAQANEAAGAEVETYSREDIEEMLAERDRAWQRRITPLQQERAELRRQAERVATLEGRLSQMESQRGRPAEEDGHLEEPEWDNIDTGQALKKAVKAQIEYENRKRSRTQPSSRPKADEGYVSPAEERMEAMLLERDLEKLGAKYPGMTADEQRQILELSERTGNGDMGYLAYQLFGSPGDWKGAKARDDDDSVPDETTSRRLSKQAMLRGRARAQASSAEAPKVKVRRGQGGYRDATGIAEEWLKSRGHS